MRSRGGSIRYYFQTGIAILRGFMNEPDSTTSSVTDSDLLDPYEKLVQVEILGQQVQVPDKNRLLRFFQYLSLNSIS